MGTTNMSTNMFRMNATFAVAVTAVCLAMVIAAPTSDEVVPETAIAETVADGGASVKERLLQDSSQQETTIASDTGMVTRNQFCTSAEQYDQQECDFQKTGSRRRGLSGIVGTHVASKSKCTWWRYFYEGERCQFQQDSRRRRNILLLETQESLQESSKAKNQLYWMCYWVESQYEKGKCPFQENNVGGVGRRRGIHPRRRSRL